jgi:RNA-directed DNA polymerase
VRNTEWGESQKNPLIYSIIGKLALSLRLGNRSRMSREVHVRCCEQLEGKFLGLTRLLLMGKYYFSREILSYIHRIMENMGLTLNRDKTKLLHSCRSSLFYLGFEFRNIKSKFGWNTKNYTNVRPSMKSRSKLYAKLRELLAKRRHWTIEWIVWKVNQLLIGWLNYFSISKVTHIWETIKVIKKHLDYKLFKWMKSKGRKAHRKLRQRPYENLVKFYGLLDIEKYARLKTLAKAQ